MSSVINCDYSENISQIEKILILIPNIFPEILNLYDTRIISCILPNEMRVLGYENMSFMWQLGLPICSKLSLKCSNVLAMQMDITGDKSSYGK